MASIYKALDLQNEIEKFKYYLKDKYSKDTDKLVMLHNLSIELNRNKLCLEEFIYKIEFNNFTEHYTINVTFKNINDFEIEYYKTNDDKNALDIIRELKEYLGRLFRLNYRMNFE